MEDKITHRELQERILDLEWKGNKFVKDIEIKKGLYHCIAKIACSKKLNMNKKKHMLQQIKEVFGFNDQELIELYQSYVPAEKKQD